MPTTMLDGVTVIARGTNIDNSLKRPGELDIPLPAPDFSRFPIPIPKFSFKLPCPELGGVSFKDEFNWTSPALNPSSRNTLQGIADYLSGGGRIRITTINSAYTGQRLHTKTIKDGGKIIGESTGVENRGADIMNARLRVLVRELVHRGAPRRSINTRNVRFNLGVGNSNVGFDCD